MKHCWEKKLASVQLCSSYTEKKQEPCMHDARKWTMQKNTERKKPTRFLLRKRQKLEVPSQQYKRTKHKKFSWAIFGTVSGASPVGTRRCDPSQIGVVETPPGPHQIVRIVDWTLRWTPPPLPTLRNGSNPQKTSKKPQRAAHTAGSPNLTKFYTHLPM